MMMMRSADQIRRQRSGRSSKLIRTATVAAAALAAATSVTALQPQRQPIKPKLLSARTSTRLDYVNVATPETESESKTVDELERLLKVELSMERQMPAEIGVTVVSPNSAVSSATPPVIAVSDDTIKQQAKLPPKKKKTKKLVTLTEKAKKVRKRRRRSASPHPTSRLSTAGKRKRKSNVKQQQQRERTDLDTVYWVRKDRKRSLLTKEEEILLTDRIRSLRRAEHIRDEHLHNHVPLNEAQWAAACGWASLELRKVIRQGQDARSELVQANMGLVTAIAKRQHASLKHAMEAGNGVGTILTLQDCLQEGQIGLIKAAERFDPMRGVRFSTYATWWIRQRILRSISDSSRIIRLPAHVHSKLMKIRKAKKDMQQQIGREPSLPELAHYLEMPVDKLRQYTQSSINVVSLENPLRPTNSGKNDIDTRTIGDTIASDAPTPLEDAQQESLRRDVEQVLLEALTTTERAVIWARYGLEDGNSKTLEETSRMLGVSRERVRLVEAKALNKLRSPQKNYRLKTYVGGSLNHGYAGMSKPSSSSKTIKQKETQHDAPWLTESPTTSKDVDTNPFASPFGYASMVQGSSRESRYSSGEGHNERNEMTKAYEHQASDLRSVSSTTAAPDRLWFF